MTPKKQCYVTALDIGSSKTACFVARISADITDVPPEERLSMVSIVASAQLPSKGIRQGTITDLEATESVVRNVLESVEQDIGEPIDRIWVNSSAGNPKTSYYSSSISIEGFVKKENVMRLYDNALDQIYANHDYVMHAIPVNFTIDGSDGIVNPVGMRAEKCDVQIMAITADLIPLKNLGLCIEKCHAEIGGRAVSPYASALGCLVGSERKTGAICIDFGADTLSIVAFFEDNVVYCDVIKLGGSYITKDISQYFSTPLASAENLKCEKGTCQIWGTERDSLDVPIIGEDFDTPTFETIPRSALVEIIRPRAEEMLETIRDRLKNVGLFNVNNKLVFTGGGAQLGGLSELCVNILNAKPRIACPMRLAGMPQNMSGPAYSTLTGLMCYAIAPPTEIPPEKLFRKSYAHKGTHLGKIFHWLKQNF